MVKTVNVDLRSLTQSELLLVAEELRRQVASWRIKHAQVRIEVKMLRHQVLTDVLTGVGNRRSFNESLKDEMARAKRNLGKPLSLAVLDIDFFKKINDTYGHAGGDAVLKTLGAFLLKFARTTDTVCRYGGEEFVLILPGTSSLGAFTLVERLRKMLEADFKAESIKAKKKVLIRLTASFGIATWDEEESSEGFLNRADSALYKAKEGGRNQVCVAG